MPEIFKFIIGYLYVEIGGNYPERFLNVCAANRIRLWDYNKKGKKLYVKMFSSDYLKIRPIRRRCDVTLRIVSRHGLPKKVKPYKKRYGALIGVALYFAVIFLLTNFIWNIEIIGNKKIPKEVILDNCKSIGVFEGAVKSGINCEEARHKLILANNDISWASFIIEGSHVTVNITETLKVEKSDTSPSNLVAKCDGVIERIEIKRGMPMVRVNQAVQKGELLASGAMQYTDGTTHFVNSSGKVIAKTKIDHTVKIPQYIDKKNYTGVVEIRRQLRIFGIDFPLSFTPINYTADKKYIDIKVSCGTSYIPIYITETSFRQYGVSRVKLSRKEMLDYAKNQLKKYENSKLSQAEILDYTDDIVYNDNNINVTRHYTCRENIAEIKKIKISTVN